MKHFTLTSQTFLITVGSLDTSPYVDVKIKNITKHPDYNSTKKRHNIALIELEKEVFSDNIIPACLNDDPSDVKKNLTSIGWGNSKIDGTDGNARSEWLLKIPVEEVPVDECRAAYPKSKRSAITDLHLCTIDHMNRNELCKGSGGSSVGTSMEGKYFTHGLTSFGMGCGHGFPSVATRVASYIEWIEGIVWP